MENRVTKARTHGPSNDLGVPEIYGSRKRNSRVSPQGRGCAENRTCISGILHAVEE